MRTRDEIAADLAVPGPKTLDDLDAGGLWIQARHRLARDVPALLAALGVAEAALARVRSLPHADWCCAKGCAGPGFCAGCAGGEDDCKCLVSLVAAALAPTPEPPKAK